MSPALEVAGLSVELPGPDGPRPIVRDVSFAIGAHEAVALVGESGSGKSMTARSVMRLLPPRARVSGSVKVAGDEVGRLRGRALRALRGRRVGMIFQDPRAHVNPVHTIGDFLVEGLTATGGVGRAEARRRVLELLERVGVAGGERRLRQYPHELSGGLLQRVMLASVLVVEPELILADEPTTALDVTTQADVIALIDELRRERGTALLMITHDLELAAATCDRTLVMYAGSLVEESRSAELHQQTRHPYTAALAASRPDIRRRRERLPSIPGRPVAAFEAVDGCPFAPRCRHAEPVCGRALPALRQVGDGRSACVRVEQLLGTPALRPEEVGDA